MNLFTKSTFALTIAIAMVGCGSSNNSSNNDKSPPSEPPIKPIDPNSPSDPIDPNNPSDPKEPTKPTDPKDPTPIIKNCAVTEAQWKKLAIGDTLDKINTTLGCKGFKSAEDVSLDAHTHTYIWGENLHQPTIQVEIENNKLITTSYTPNFKTDSECLPTVQKFESLTDKQSLAEVNNILGCQGIHVVSSLDNKNLVTSQYYWTKNLEQKFGFFVSFYDGKLNHKFHTAHEAAKCTPTRQEWDKVLLGSSISGAEKELGCAGVTTVENNIFSMESIVKSWGHALLNSNQTTLTFTDKALSSKVFNYADKKTSCTPNAKEWLAVPIGASYEQTQSSMGCQGFLSRVEMSEFEPNLLRSTYLWKNYTTEEEALDNFTQAKNHTFTFAKDSLTEKYFMNPFDNHSTCQPSAESFNKIQLDKPLSDAEKVIGCNASLFNAVQTQYSLHRVYAWGVIKNMSIDNHTRVVLDEDDYVVEKHITFNPK